MNRSEILDALGVEGRSPGLRFLGELFEAFNRRVLFESASKIVRNEEEASLPEKPRTPDLFWREHLELGTGGTCFARTAGFRALLSSLGFETEAILAAVHSPGSHAALLVEADRARWLVDVGFPLPAVLPLERREIEGLTGEGLFEPGEGSALFSFLAGPEAGRRIDFDLKPVSPEDFHQAWIRSFALPSLFLKDVVVRLQEEARVLRLFRGELHILDSRTRTVLPAAAIPAGRLSELFGIDADLLGRALALAGDFDAPDPQVRIEAYLDRADSAELFALLTRPEGYRRFVSGLGSVSIVPLDDRRFRAELDLGNGTSTAEEVEVSPDRLRVSVRRREGLAETGFRLEETEAGPRIAHYALLEGGREEMLRSDLARGRISALLSIDLLALSRFSEL